MISFYYVYYCAWESYANSSTRLVFIWIYGRSVCESIGLTFWIVIILLSTSSSHSINKKKKMKSNFLSIVPARQLVWGLKDHLYVH